MPATATSAREEEKDAVRRFWQSAPCGLVYAQGADPREQLAAHAAARYALEPYIRPFAGFDAVAGLDVLEIGVGLGADHLELAKGKPRTLVGIDLTHAAAAATTQRLSLHGRRAGVIVADAERLPFDDATFDVVYSYGVLHHSPDTAAAVREAHRLLRPGGRARIMIYHKHSVVGYCLWLRYALARLQPLRSLDSIYAAHVESPGTKAYTVPQARRLFAQFSSVSIRAQLGPGDLMLGAVGQRHRGPLLSLAKRFWPRALIRRVAPGLGLGLLIEATK